LANNVVGQGTAADPWVCVPLLMEALGMAELQHNPRKNRMRAI